MIRCQIKAWHRKGIVWTNDSSVYWPILASPGRDMLWIPQRIFAWEGSHGESDVFRCFYMEYESLSQIGVFPCFTCFHVNIWENYVSTTHSQDSYALLIGETVFWYVGYVVNRFVTDICSHEVIYHNGFNDGNSAVINIAIKPILSTNNLNVAKTLISPLLR